MPRNRFACRGAGATQINGLFTRPPFRFRFAQQFPRLSRPPSCRRGVARGLPSGRHGPERSEIYRGGKGDLADHARGTRQRSRIHFKQHQATPEQVGPAKMPMVETVMLKNMVLKKLILDKAAALPLKDVDKEEAAELDRLKGPAARAGIRPATQNGRIDPR